MYESTKKTTGKKIKESTDYFILDNGGETADRYTLIDKNGEMYGFNEKPFHPQGFAQYAGSASTQPGYTSAEAWAKGFMAENPSNKLITLNDLTADAQSYVKQMLESKPAKKAKVKEDFMHPTAFEQGFNDGLTNKQASSTDAEYIKGWDEGKVAFSRIAQGMRGGIDDIGLVFAEAKKRMKKVQEGRVVLMTSELLRKLPPLYSQDGKPSSQVMVVAHYFSPYSNWDWYATEYDPNQKLFFGLVKGFEKELGYFSLAEFEETNASKSPPPIERDLYWTPVSLAEIKKQVGMSESYKVPKFKSGGFKIKTMKD